VRALAIPDQVVNVDSDRVDDFLLSVILLLPYQVYVLSRSQGRPLSGSAPRRPRSRELEEKERCEKDEDVIY